MALVVSLKEIVDAMDLPDDEWQAYLDPQTGEIIMVTDEDILALERSNPDELPDWQRDLLPGIRKAVEENACLELPSPFDIHEWAMMKRFCGTVDDPAAQEQLLAAIHGRGAFRAFRSALERTHLRDAWFAYRQAKFEQIARDWLEEHQIAYE